MFARLSSILIAIMLITAPIAGGAQMMLPTISASDAGAATITLDSPEAARPWGG